MYMLLNANGIVVIKAVSGESSKVRLPAIRGQDKIREKKTTEISVCVFTIFGNVYNALKLIKC